MPKFQRFGSADQIGVGGGPCRDRGVGRAGEAERGRHQGDYREWPTPCLRGGLGFRQQVAQAVLNAVEGVQAVDRQTGFFRLCPHRLELSLHYVRLNTFREYS